MRLICSDIDGTLLNSDHQVSSLTKEAIREAVGQGVVFVPVSARMPKAIQLIVENIGITCPIISYNGGLIQDENGTVLDSKTLPVSDAIELGSYIENHYPAVAWNVYSFERWLAQATPSKWVDREEEIVGVKAERFSLEQLQQEMDQAHKVLLMGEAETISHLVSKLPAVFPDFSIVQSHAFLLEIMPKGIEKGQAVVTLSQQLEIPLSETVAFGDNFNDLEMLRVVGQAVVMGNAPQDIQEEFSFVTADNDHDGIAVALKQLGIGQDEL
ncbi:Cof-type HAD-IIB family hydrolase [Streptococcus cameli]